MKYISKYSNGKTVTAAQYITEIICQNKATLEKKDLHYKFWTNKEWSKFFRNQIATANKLISKYSEKAIINALKNPKASRIFSLRAPHLIPIIENEQKILESTNTTLSQSFDRSNDKKFDTNKPKEKNILSKLKELE
jgi:hypothetical protein